MGYASGERLVHDLIHDLRQAWARLARARAGKEKARFSLRQTGLCVCG